MSRSISTLILGIAFCVTHHAVPVAAAGAVCSSGIYAVLAPLSGNSLAQSFCTRKYPLAPVTITATTSVTITAPTVTSTADTSTVTADTTTVTADPETDTITTSVTTTSTVTVTTTSTTAPAQKRDHTALMQRGHLTTTTKKTTTSTKTSTNTSKTTSTSTTSKTTTSAPNRLSSELSVLSSLANAVASTFCSCIETPQTVTATTTNSITTTPTVTSTPVTTVTPSTTVTPTVTSTETDTATGTVTTTSTAYVACSTNLSNDKFNCGACGNKCTTGYECSGGSCDQPSSCSAPGPDGVDIYYCNSADTCICYETVEGLGYCDSSANGNACGAQCSTSDDCPNGAACETAASSGCPSNVCSNSKCPTAAKRMFMPRGVSVKRAPLVKNYPQSASNSTSI